MGILASIASQWRFGLYGLIAAGLLIAGWTVNGWRQDAARLSDAKAAIRDAQEKMASAQRLAVQADELRATMGVKLADAEDALRAATATAKTVIRRVYVKTDPRCDLEPSVLRVLNAARAGRGAVQELPPAPDPSPTEGEASKATTAR